MQRDQLNMSTKQVGKKILNLSISQLSQETQVNKGCWSRYFSGKFSPSIANLRRISKTYNITTDEVLNQIEERISKCT